MQRQVTMVCPRTGRTVWVYEDHGPSAALPLHGSPGGPRSLSEAVGFVAPKVAGTRRSV